MIRGDPALEYWDLMVVGAALEEHEGRVVTVRIGIPERPPERLGAGQTLVKDGTFSLFFPAVWEAQMYKVKRVWIDGDGDGICNQADFFWADSSATWRVLTVRGGNLPTMVGNRDLDCIVFNEPWPSE